MSDHFPEKHRQLWPSSGWMLLDRTAQGYLKLTDEHLRHQLAQPDLAPLAQSCAAEISLHEAVMAEPRRAVAAAEIAAMADAVARDNWAVWLRFRAHLLAHDTLEAAYMALFQGEGVAAAPQHVGALCQALLANVLSLAAGDESEIDGMTARVADMLFRPQRISVANEGQEGHRVMAADAETVERWATAQVGANVADWLRPASEQTRSVDLDVITPDNAAEYLARGERFDLAVPLNHGQPALNALARVLELWVAHFTGCRVGIKVAREIDDARWVWHVGLDAQASAVLNAAFQDEEVDEASMGRMLCLFELHFVNPHDARADLGGNPVYLAMGMDEQQLMQLKAQNLLLNLPFARRL